MSEDLEDNEPRVIPLTIDNTQNEHIEPLVGTEHAPRVVCSVSSDPGESALPSSGVATPVRPAPHRSTPRARRMSLPLTHVDAWPVAKMTLMLSIVVAITQVVISAIVWVLLDVVDVFSQTTQIVSSADFDADGFDLKNVLSLTIVVSGVTVFSTVEVVVFALLTIITALIYNVISSLVGGVHITLGDD